MQREWVGNDRDIMQRMLGPNNEISEDAEELYFKVVSARHSVLNGPIGPDLLLTIAIFTGCIGDPPKYESPLVGLQPGSWVQCKRGTSVIRGTFQGMKPPPLESMAVVWIENDESMEIAVADNAVEIVETQPAVPVQLRREAPPRPTSIVPKTGKDQFDPDVDPFAGVEQSEDSPEPAEDAEPSAGEIFTWARVVKGTNVQANQDGNLKLGVFWGLVDDRTVAVKFGGAKPVSFSVDDVRILPAAKEGELKVVPKNRRGK